MSLCDDLDLLTALVIQSMCSCSMTFGTSVENCLVKSCGLFKNAAPAHSCYMFYSDDSQDFKVYYVCGN